MKTIMKNITYRLENFTLFLKRLKFMKISIAFILILFLLQIKLII